MNIYLEWNNKSQQITNWRDESQQKITKPRKRSVFTN